MKAKLYWLKMLAGDGTYYLENRRGKEIYRFPITWQVFEKMFPVLKIRKDQRHLIKITQLKHGVKLEKLKTVQGFMAQFLWNRRAK